MHNRQLLLRRRPTGGEPAQFELTLMPRPTPRDGEVLVRNLYASMDPAMRGWMRAQTYIPPVGVGEVMRALTVGEVVQTKASDIAPGTFVTGLLGLQDYAVTRPEELQRIDPSLAPLTAYCGGLGMTGQTAYFGMTEIARPAPGQTVLVSSAAGATGSVAGQIAKIAGCRVVGIAGGPEKCAFLLTQLGFDDAIDYRQGELSDSIRKACPDGIDVFFDNVGGVTLDAALLNLRRRARVVLCGAIAQAVGSAEGAKQLIQVAFQHATIEGFVVFEYKDRFAEATAQLASWYRDRKLVFAEHVEAGLERFPEVLNMLFEGKKTGKLVLKIAENL